MRLHWNRVRRARGMPMPLPPEPKRPLGPPVVFAIDGHPIRMRSEAEAAYGSWEAFLDRAVKVGLRMLDDPYNIGQPHAFWFDVAKLAPEAERTSLRLDLNRRMWALRKARHAEMEVAGTSIAPQVARPPSILARLFGKAA
ncbi:hypothetical protein [Methylobacterium radiotolerans]|uniref:Uncharacterized protein n=1 Tax=Methylobacterium radiotolerans (strain ATCC 27329 / DSM 1819 / JCM 2831 / NBRC 15690 / NCIMB 10815 / 0-1) TaxID=426355 RepID=B1LXD4_METRJ|nr:MULTISPECIES: hypothetical protein [Methylobacterium]ACB27255.1 hypothetical protein Mrad2831_5308 [Methylobacterium radiotolerans JCM 2831]GEM98248.1 hypothetical protein MRA01_27880 [Methylobacterium radiotolerans]